MNLRFFADQCVPNLIIETLRSWGNEVLRLRDYLHINALDSVVISKAQELNTILITMNGDFADIITYPPKDYKGIIALQVRNHPEVLPQVLILLNGYLSSHKNMNDYEGKLFLVEPHRIRIRR
jgi:predicted nuclease of predicted toxin-antitoxin system